VTAQQEADRMMREFHVWQFSKQLKDDERLASILKAWGFQVGRA